MIHKLLAQRTGDLHISLLARLRLLLSDELPLQLDKRLKLPLPAGDLASLAVPAEALAKMPVRDRLRHLKAVMPLNEDGFFFFNSYGENVGREEYGDREAIVNSACETFASLERWFSLAAIIA